MNPTFEYEQKLWNNNVRFVAGADEVGRGAFAGPVVAAAVSFDSSLSSLSSWLRSQKAAGNWMSQIRDSKKMSPKQREITAKYIKENCYWGIGEASVAIINKLGIVEAVNMAFRKAILELKFHTSKVDHLLIDAFYIPYVKGIERKNQTALIKGDAKSISIAAASIIAKVYRDELMANLSRKFKEYKWQKNAGYGTKEHRNAILALGSTKQHRTQYVNTFLAKVT